MNKNIEAMDLKFKEMINEIQNSYYEFRAEALSEMKKNEKSTEEKYENRIKALVNEIEKLKKKPYKENLSIHLDKKTVKKKVTSLTEEDKFFMKQFNESFDEFKLNNEERSLFITHINPLIFKDIEKEMLNPSQEAVENLKKNPLALLRFSEQMKSNTMDIETLRGVTKLLGYSTEKFFDYLDFHILKPGLNQIKKLEGMSDEDKLDEEFDYIKVNIKDKSNNRSFLYNELLAGDPSNGDTTIAADYERGKAKLKEIAQKEGSAVKPIFDYQFDQLVAGLL